MSSRGVNFGGCNHDTIRTGKDIACSGVPFNWNGSLIGADPSGYLAGLRVGYIKESFDIDDELAKDLERIGAFATKFFQQLVTQARVW